MSDAEVPDRLPGPIVVGVDGSECAVEALRWALAEARQHGAPLRVVCAWTFPGLSILPVAPMPTPQELVGRANSTIESALQAAGDVSGVDVEWRVVEGPPARVLIEAARGARLLVVGARGVGGFRGLLLGSVSQQCAHHAPCPVVIVHGRREKADAHAA